MEIELRGRKFDAEETNARRCQVKKKLGGISKKKCAFRGKKCMYQNVEAEVYQCYEYVEKRVCITAGDAAVLRLRVSKETQYIR
jgi:hypothetical protein